MKIKMALVFRNRYPKVQPIVCCMLVIEYFEVIEVICHSFDIIRDFFVRYFVIVMIDLFICFGCNLKI